MMHGPYIAFSDDVRDFPTYLVRDELVSQQVEAVITPEGSNKEVVNPVLQSMGFANLQLADAKEMDTISGEGRKRSVAPQLKRLSMVSRQMIRFR